MHRIIGPLVTAALTVAGALIAATPATAATPDVSAATGWSSCPTHYFCVWNAHDGKGKMCEWVDNSPDWTKDCSWADSELPMSVYNNGTSGAGVVIYHTAGYGEPIGACVAKGKKVNLAGTYFIGSHAWVC